ncbi:hypothetical protein STFE110948_04280 [Streptobacillus felis]|uniref:Outer membrane protein beta-barrel domain-containing protein n=1 Tax=Streptobacillus felis TaxID=1384509 RepID=A0A7Z0T837_9FUSO|nr:hypothetical protein [Streptobacillus felis]NYV27499.1 hypothetical protein [Streptobacillus felis]
MKKILLGFVLFAGLTSFSATVTGPRYRVEGSAAYNGEFKKDGGHGANFSLGVMPEWKYDVSKDLDLTFGPKISVSGGFAKTEDKMVGQGSVNLALAGEVNYAVAKEVKVYGGTELGMGLLIKPNKEESNEEKKAGVNFGYLAKASIGLKLQDKYNVAVFGGYGTKGIVGIEAGYTF